METAALWGDNMLNVTREDYPLSQPTTKSIIMSDAVIEGDVTSNGEIVVKGRVQGNLSAQSVEVGETGGVYGSLKAKDADVYGDVQGDVSIIGLIRIGQTGSVTGDVAYGRISMEQGGNLSATMRNVPPHLSGDLHVTVKRGGAVRITTVDLTAFDPDDSAKDLTYKVANPVGGRVALSADQATAVTQFTQADLEAGRVMFVHDGSAADTAGFDTVVTDSKGATSGEARHVTVDVKG